MRRIFNPSLSNLLEVYEDENSVFLVFQFFTSKDLSSEMKEQYLEEKHVADLLYKLLQGLTHLHEEGIFHRDLKLENILYRMPDNLSEVLIGNYTLADFCEPPVQLSPQA
jgi:serine/threonine protein kinase